jgi:hypothetical protein
MANALEPKYNRRYMAGWQKGHPTPSKLGLTAEYVELQNTRLVQQLSKPRLLILRIDL